MLSFAVKHLKTCSSLRNTRNYIAQLSIANPKELRFFTWRKVRAWNFRSDLTAPNHNSVRKTAYPVFQETLHMREIKSSQLKTCELCSSTWWITRILGRVKEKSEHACSSQIVILMGLSPSLANIYYRSHLIPCALFPARLWKVRLFTAYISLLKESKKGFYI